MKTTIKILEKLVGFKTVSLNSNLELIDYIESYLLEFGIKSERIYSEDGLRANLFATIGRTDRGGICFAGHSDVVPVDNQPWSSEPFVLTSQSGRYYGRGSADMKGYLACVLSLVPEFIAATRLPDALPLHIAVSYDEEIGCVGIRSLIEKLANQKNKPIACIVGEPTMMNIATAHKGKNSWKCGVHGVAAHSSNPQLGVNAIEYASEMVTFLTQNGRKWRETENNAHYSPPFSTIQVGTIKGGTAVNVVPDYCEFEFEVRPLPSASINLLLETFDTFIHKKLIPEMQQVDKSSGINLIEKINYPGLIDNPSLDDIKKLCSKALGESKFSSLAFGTEAGLFQQAGIPTVVCGPGSINQAHKADEYVTEQQLQACISFLREIIKSK